MKNKILPMTAVLTLFVSAPLRADDVYNFYFQKAPGPATVVQGGGKAEVSAKVEALPVVPEKKQETNESATSKTQKIEKPLEEKSEIRKWAVMGGAVYLEQPNDIRRGWMLGTEFHLNKFVGFNLGLLLTKTEKLFWMDTEKSREQLDFSLGAMLTPLRLNFFGYDLIDVSLIGGAMSAREATYCVNFGVRFPCNGSSYVKPYGGMNLSLNVGTRFSLVGQYLDTWKNNKQARLTLAARF